MPQRRVLAVKHRNNGAMTRNPAPRETAGANGAIAWPIRSSAGRHDEPHGRMMNQRIQQPMDMLRSGGAMAAFANTKTRGGSRGLCLNAKQIGS